MCGSFGRNELVVVLGNLNASVGNEVLEKKERKKKKKIYSN